MRLIDADAYAKEMRERQDACEAAINAESYEGETFSLRQHWEGVLAAFVEAKLTLDSMPTVEKQEPVKPIRQEGLTSVKCGKCDSTIPLYCIYCPFCGRKVKWDAD